MIIYHLIRSILNDVCNSFMIFNEKMEKERVIINEQLNADWIIGSAPKFMYKKITILFNQIGRYCSLWMTNITFIKKINV